MLKETLLGVEFLHKHEWIHGDLKPENIGIRSMDPPQIILLDLCSAIKIPASGKIQPTPGLGGTVAYLAPERETEAYDAAVDMWSLGVVGLESLHGCHPWLFQRNPWRQENLDILKPEFESKYNCCIERLKKAPVDGFDNLLLRMVRFPQALNNSDRRISAPEALHHPCWKEPSDDDDCNVRP